MLVRAFLVVLVLPALLSAFKAYWNFPSATCQKNYSVKFEDFKIETNTNVSFYGEKVVIFYEFIFGRYPYYKGYNKSYPIHGGLPQNCSLDEHLKIAEQNITDKIKNKNFDGLAIIDLEEWRPLFDQNFWGLKSIFRNESIALAKTVHPNVTNDTELQKLAEEDFNKAAREFFVKTIQLGRKLRGNAKWGFYGFPYCNYNAGKNGTTECWKKYQDWNDNIACSTTFRMMFIFNESDALFPSIYLGSNATSQERFLYVQAVLNEARRISKKFTPPKPIYAYTKIEYDPLKKIDDFYDEKDLCSTIRQPADLGIDGIIIWSSSRNITLRCPYIQEKMTMNEGIGSKVKTIIEQHDQCRKTRCSDQGKCIRSTNSTCPGFTTMNTEEYYCECDYGYHGTSCESQDSARLP